jgi:hypothetical protein
MIGEQGYLGLQNIVENYLNASLKQSLTDEKAVISEERGISEEQPLSQLRHERAEVALSSQLLHGP